MTENKRYVRILDHSEKEVRIFDEHNQKNIFNIFFMGLDSAICLKGALEDTVDLLNELSEENEQLKSDNNRLVHETAKIVVKHQRNILVLIDRKINDCENIKPLVKSLWKIEALEELKKELIG